MESSAEPEAKKPTRFLPAATFVVGLVLGGGVIAIATGSDGSDDSPPGAGATSSSAAVDADADGGGTDTNVTIPAACSEAADDATRVIELVRGSVAAVRDFDPTTVDKNLDELEALDPELRAKAQECTAVRVSPAASQETATPSDSSSAVASQSASQSASASESASEAASDAASATSTP